MHLGPAEPAGHYALSADCIPGEIQLAQVLAQRIKRQARIDKGAEDHVAARPAEAVEIGDATHAAPAARARDAASWLAMRAALAPAPMPLSIFTTVNPGTQVC